MTWTGGIGSPVLTSSSVQFKIAVTWSGVRATARVIASDARTKDFASSGIRSFSTFTGHRPVDRYDPQFLKIRQELPSFHPMIPDVTVHAPARQS
jgi:hypothetical protein